MDSFRLEVNYVANGADKPKRPWECWLKQEPNDPVSVTVLQKGGNLMLTCRECKSPQKIIRMEME